MIEKIERIRAELEIESFGNGKLSADGEINLGEWEATDVVPSLGTLSFGWRSRERCGIQDLSPRSPRHRNPNRLTGNKVWTGKYRSKPAQREQRGIKWESTSGHNRRVDGPISCENREKTGFRGGRNIISESPRKAVPYIETGRSAVNLSRENDI